MKRFAVLMILMLAAFTAVSAQETVELTFVHIFGGEQDSRVEVLRAIADEFEAANPGVTITLQSPSTDYTEVFNAALLSASQGDAPTIVQVEEGLTQLAADSTFFVPVGSLASAEQLASLEDVLPVVRNYYAIGDDIWSIPWNSSNPLFFYNKNFFRAAGLDPDVPPATFADVTAACAIVASKPLSSAAALSASSLAPTAFRKSAPPESARKASWLSISLEECENLLRPASAAEAASRISGFSAFSNKSRQLWMMA